MNIAATTLAAGGATALGAEIEATRGVADIYGSVRTRSTVLVTALELSAVASLHTKDGEGNDNEGLSKVHGVM